MRSKWRTMEDKGSKWRTMEDEVQNLLIFAVFAFSSPLIMN